MTSDQKKNNQDLSLFYSEPVRFFGHEIKVLSKRRLVQWKFIPKKLFAYVNDMELEKDEKILCNNLPFVYYYTNKKFVYYWCGDDLYWDSNGKHPLIESKNGEQVSQFVKQNLNCKYIFSYIPYDKYDLKFERFLKTHCTIIKQEGEYILYKIY